MTDHEQIPGFELKRVISRSAIATVYEAYQPSLNRKAFLKKLHPQFAKDAELRARFEREAQICAKIKHLNLVDIYEYITSEDQVVLVLEFVEGSSLAELLKSKGPFPVNVVVSILMGILEGLAYAHAKGVIHRDLKPENILISEEGIVKISDWGLSFSPELGVLTHQGMAVGTPAYMSPEAASGGQITFRSDLFSLGVTIYEMFTGKRIFQGASISETLKMVLSDTPRRLQEFRDDVPSGLDRLVGKLLEKSPNRRFTSASEVRERLRSVLEEHPMDVGASVILDYMEVPSTAVSITPSRSEKIRIRKRRTLIGSWILVVLLLVVAWLVLRPHGEKKAPSDLLSAGSVDTAATFAEQLTGDSLPGTIADIPQDDKESPVLHDSSARPSGEAAGKQPGESSRDRTAAVIAGKDETAQPPRESATRTEPEEVVSDTTTELAYIEPIPQGKGYLQIICDPWANIFIDNRFIGQTPISQNVEVEAGQVQLVFVNPEFPPVMKNVKVEPDQSQRVSVNLWDYVGVINIHVRPWADIYIDGEYLDRTPLSKPIILPLGTHYLRLVNEYFHTWEDTLVFKQGDVPVDLRIALEPRN